MIRRWLMSLSVERVAVAAAALLFCVPFLVPVQGPPVPSFWPEWLALLLGFAAATVLLQGRVEWAPPGVPLMALGFAGLAGVLVLQLALEMVAFPTRSSFAIVYALWAALLVAAGRRMMTALDAGSVLFAFQVALAVAAFGESIVALMQAGRITVATFSIGPAEAVGLMGQRNHLANLVSCGLWSVVFLAGRRRMHWITAVLTAAPMIVVLVLSGSRSVWVYAAIALAVLAVAWLTSRRLWMEWDVRMIGGVIRRTFVIAFAVGVALVIAQMALQGESGARVAEALSAGGNTGDALRLVLWQYAAAMFAQAPLLGVGFGEFAWKSFALAPEVGVSLGGRVDIHAHNLAAQLFAETGLLGALCILVPLVAWIACFPWNTLRPSTAWIAVIVGIQLFHGSVEFPQWYAHFLGPLALLLGAGSTVKHFVQFAQLRQVANCLIAAGACVLVWAAMDYGALAAWQREVTAQAAPATPGTHGGRAGAITPGQFERLMALRDTLFGWKLEPAVAIHTTAGSAHETEAALAITGAALHAHPMPALAAHMVRLLEAAGQPEGAAWMRRAAGAAFGDEKEKGR